MSLRTFVCNGCGKESTTFFDLDGVEHYVGDDVCGTNQLKGTTPMGEDPREIACRLFEQWMQGNKKAVFTELHDMMQFDNPFTRRRANRVSLELGTLLNERERGVLHTLFEEADEA